jgi:hypothetical protein
MICPTGEAKYFCKGDWTGFSTARPSGKSPGNPLPRFDANTNMSETFAYDRLNRLTSATVMVLEWSQCANPMWCVRRLTWENS